MMPPVANPPSYTPPPATDLKALLAGVEAMRERFELVKRQAELQARWTEAPSPPRLSDDDVERIARRVVALLREGQAVAEPVNWAGPITAQQSVDVWFGPDAPGKPDETRTKCPT